MKVSANTVVEMNYRLFSEDGQLLETTANEDGPVRYRHGAEEILPGLEKGLEGAEAGGTVRMTLEASDAYGEYNPEGLVSVPRTELPSGQDYEPGDWISVVIDDDEQEHDHATCDHDHSDNEMEMRVVEAHETEIVLDANHPLAGKRLIFEVDVLSVEAAS